MSLPRFELTEKWPFGERGHGVDGIFEYYSLLTKSLRPCPTNARLHGCIWSGAEIVSLASPELGTDDASADDLTFDKP